MTMSTNKMTVSDPPPPFPEGDVDIKEKVEHEENAYQEERIALKSQFDDLTAWQALKTFKVVSLYCCAAAFSAATDGYQVGRSSLNFASFPSKAYTAIVDQHQRQHPGEQGIHPPVRNHYRCCRRTDSRCCLE